jgi:hypothetical protein
MDSLALHNIFRAHLGGMFTDFSLAEEATSSGHR